MEQEAGGQEKRGLFVRPSPASHVSGRMGPGGRYGPLLSPLIWDCWLLHHVPNGPWSRGPCCSLPGQTVTGFPLFGEGVGGCLLN